jgi:hypothetical protein
MRGWPAFQPCAGRIQAKTFVSRDRYKSLLPHIKVSRSPEPLPSALHPPHARVLSKLNANCSWCVCVYVCVCVPVLECMCVLAKAIVLHFVIRHAVFCNSSHLQSFYDPLLLSSRFYTFIKFCVRSSSPFLMATFMKHLMWYKFLETSVYSQKWNIDTSIRLQLRLAHSHLLWTQGPGCISFV